MKTRLGDSASNRRPEAYEPPPRTISRAYGRAVAGFSLVAVLAAALVLLFTTSHATVTVGARGEQQHVGFDVAVMPSGDRGSADAAAVPGRLLEVATTTAVTVDVPRATGTADATAKARGTVTLRNSSGSPQPLVATTRLLSPDNVLFRLDSSTVVPANGQVEAQVTADVAGPGGAIAPTTFTIPGLNESRRQQVDAISSAPFALPTVGGNVLTAESLAAAQVKALEVTLTALWPELEAQLLEGETIDPSVATATAISFTASAEPGAEATAVTFSGQVRASVLLFDRSALEGAVVRFLFGEGTAAQPEPGTLQLAVSRSSTIAGALGTVTGQLTVTASPAAVSPDSLVGRTKAEAEAYLKGLPGVSEVSIKVRPWWLRRLPGEASRIQVRVVPLP